MTRFCGFLCYILSLAAFPALAAPVFPTLTGRIVDEANIIQPADRAALEAKLAGIEQATGHQMVIATIADMRDYPLEDYAYQLGRAWGIGGKGANDGLIILLAPNNPAGQRGPRIEVGYGLEPIVTDAFANQVAKGLMTPRLRAGDVAGGLNAGVDALAAQIRLTPEEAAKRAQAAAAAQSSRQRGGGINVGTLVFWGIVLLIVVVPMMRGARGRRYRGSSGIGEAILWTAINAAVNSRSSGSGWSSGGGGDWGGGGGGGGFSGGGGSFGGGGASGDW